MLGYYEIKYWDITRLNVIVFGFAWTWTLSDQLKNPKYNSILRVLQTEEKNLRERILTDYTFSLCSLLITIYDKDMES